MPSLSGSSGPRSGRSRSPLQTEPARTGMPSCGLERTVRKPIPEDAVAGLQRVTPLTLVGKRNNTCASRSPLTANCFAPKAGYAVSIRHLCRLYPRTRHAVFLGAGNRLSRQTYESPTRGAGTQRTESNARRIIYRNRLGQGSHSAADLAGERASNGNQNGIRNQAARPSRSRRSTAAKTGSGCLNSTRHVEFLYTADI